MPSAIYVCMFEWNSELKLIYNTHHKIHSFRKLTVILLTPFKVEFFHVYFKDVSIIRNILGILQLKHEQRHHMKFF